MRPICRSATWIGSKKCGKRGPVYIPAKTILHCSTSKPIMMRSPYLLIRSAYSSSAAVSSPSSLRALSSSSSSSPTPSVPTISIDDLRSNSAYSDAAVREAFIGRSSLGALSVHVSGFDETRRKALKASAWFGLDPSAARARDSCRNSKLAGEDARVQPGWSGNPGREDHPIQSGFYCNLKEEMQSSKADEIFGENIWPDTEYLISGGSDFKGALLEAGMTMHNVTSLVLEAARDAAVSEARARGLDETNMRQITKQSETFLPLRLTYYDANHSREDTLVGGQYWLPWHVDFNTATCFISAAWIDEDQALKGNGVGEIREKGDNPESKAGLLLRNAAGDVVPASIAEDCILVQLGAYAQIKSGGLLRAGPHAVGLQDESHAGLTRTQGRLTLGLFTYSPWDYTMMPPNKEDETAVLEDDFGGLMKRAYTGDTVLAGFQSFANYMNAPRAKQDMLK